MSEPPTVPAPDQMARRRTIATSPRARRGEPGGGAGRRRRPGGAHVEGKRKLLQDPRAEEWLAALASLGTDRRKRFLGTAPMVIAVFEVIPATSNPSRTT